jgi:uncharacterized protein
LEYFRAAIDKYEVHGYIYLARLLSYGLEVKLDMISALILYKQAIQLNHPAAMCELGEIYEYGLGVEVSEEKAIELYEKAANLNYGDGLVNVGLCYERGQLGKTKNIPLAIEYYKKGMKRRNGRAYNCLAHCYAIGKGLEKNLQKTLEIFEQGVSLRLPECMNKMGGVYELGIHVERDFDKAFKYYEMGTKEFKAQSFTCLASA